MGQVLDLLKDYQLATYVFAFSAFLDPLFAENFSKDKLRDVADRIERESIRYRELYTRCYNSIEESGEGAVESALLSGLSKAGEGLGMRSPRPPPQTSPLSTRRSRTGPRLWRSFKECINSRLLERLLVAKSPDVSPFFDGTRMLKEVFIDPSELLTDGDSLYLLPGGNKHDDD